MSKMLEIKSPFDAHVHLREGCMMSDVGAYTAFVFPQAVVMGNLFNPIDNAERIDWYYNQINARLGAWFVDNGRDEFSPIMTIMLTTRVKPDSLANAFGAGARVLKWIPGNTSTGSDLGVAMSDIKEYYPVLQKAQELDMIFSVHAELVADSIAEIDREVAAIPLISQLVADFPNLKIVIEHITTMEMIEFVRQASDNVAATITAHHLKLNMWDVFDRETMTVKNPHNYCKPVAKSEADRLALVKAATSGNPKFFFGSDSAPHPLEKKLADPPSAGVWSSPVALPVLVEVFEKARALKMIQGFVSDHGLRFYKLPAVDRIVTLEKRPYTVFDSANGIVPFLAGRQLAWRVVV